VLGEVSAEATGAPQDRVNPPDLVAALDEGRVHKSDYEVACLGEANRRAMAGHLAARDAFLAGGTELDVQLAYLGASRQRESELPYSNIVGINAHGGVLHYQHHEVEAPARRQSLLVDAGHRHRGYCADITRTWPGPQADVLFTALVDDMTALQQGLIAALRPGVDFVTLHEQMHRQLAQLLVKHRLVRCSAEAAVENAITRAFCPHGLGHLLGLQVHDVGGLSDPQGHLLPPPTADPALRLTRQLEMGMVVTIEPGFYVIPLLLDPLKASPAGANIDWQKIERLAPHGGIRIEDNLCITDLGADNLTPRLGA
jgi:Xaa-Pro dipeptidase